MQPNAIRELAQMLVLARRVGAVNPKAYLDGLCAEFLGVQSVTDLDAAGRKIVISALEKVVNQ